MTDVALPAAGAAAVRSPAGAPAGRATSTAGVSEFTTPYRIATRQLLRDSLLDAARRLLEDRPWAQITMAELAREAGVSRQTLYKEFGSRDEFAQQFVIREGARLLDVVEQTISAHLDDPCAALAAGLETFLSAASHDPLVQLLLEDDGTGGALPLVTTRSRPVLDWACARLCEVMRSGWPGVRDQDAELLADTFVRLALSYLTMPRCAPRESAASVAVLLAPYIEQAMALAG